ncbi:metallophosphoesterase [Streptomyces sp. NPDC006602]|uniref:metallophosphoesterase n=1 Tax=Streptomyces sp. NPDC006602 TaxID=3364751 RepID=UPI0036950ECC
MVNGLQADLVAIVGDLADGTAAQLGPAARPLRHLESRYGSFFVTGNHEYLYDGVEDWLDEMRAVDVRPLVNERVEIRHNGAVLDLAGVEDLAGEETGRGPDLEGALSGRDTSRPVVLLAHQPVFAEEAARHGVDLQLSGHTHGGQMFPLTAVTAMSSPVTAGLGSVDDTTLYVTSGAGFFGPPVRVGPPRTSPCSNSARRTGDQGCPPAGHQRSTTAPAADETGEPHARPDHPPASRHRTRPAADRRHRTPRPRGVPRARPAPACGPPRSPHPHPRHLRRGKPASHRAPALT